MDQVCKLIARRESKPDFRKIRIDFPRRQLAGKHRLTCDIGKKIRSQREYLSTKDEEEIVSRIRVADGRLPGF